MGAEEPILHAGPRSTAQVHARRSAAARTASANYARSRLDRAVHRLPAALDFCDRRFSHFADRSAFLRYCMAVLTILLATSARLALVPVMGSQFPLLTVFFALVFAAWFGGLGPSLLALGLSLVSIPLVLDPLGTLTIHGLPAQLAFGIYLPLGLAVALMGGSMRAAQLRAEASEAAARKEQQHLEDEVAEHVLQEQALRASEQRFRRLADAIPQIVWIARPDNTLLYLNRRWLEYTGLSEEETYRPGSWMSVVHPDDLQRVNESAMRLLGGGEPFEAEYRLQDRHGNYRWFLGRAVRVTDEAGRIVSVFGTATDIDDRRRSEQAARFLADAAPRSPRWWTKPAPSSRLPASPCPTSPIGAWSTWPAKTASRNVLPLPMSIRPRWPWPTRSHRRYPPNPEASTGVSAILRSGKPELVPEVTDEMLGARARDEDHLQIIRKLGLRSYIGVPLPGRDGTLGVISFVASDSGRHYGPDDLRLAQDLANRAAIAVENARLYEKMKEADRRKDEFLATLAHELRNPLAPIRNALQLMARSSGVDHEAERAMAERLVTHLARLVDDLMDVARISRGRIELRKEVVELAPIVARVVQTVGPSAGERRHDLAVSLPEQPVLLDADPTRLEQILWNLLSNAIKYTEPGGRISLTARRQDGDLVLHVCDTGIGIPAEMLPHVFEMFSRAKPVSYRGEGGLGIGLGLVKNLVELHGGTIEAHSDGPDRGSEFLVRLPVLSHALAPVKPDACCGIREQSGTVDDCRRILIVDDNEDAATSLARLLSMLDGHSVQVAHDGPSALALAADFEPEVVILDIGMPGMDGYEVARRFRARPESQQTRLLALSGWGQEKDRERSRAAGFEHHLVKPVDLELLRGLLSRPSGHGPREADFLAAAGKQRVP